MCLVSWCFEPSQPLGGDIRADAFIWCNFVPIFIASTFSFGYTSVLRGEKKKSITVQTFKTSIFVKFLFLLFAAVSAATGPESVVAVVVMVGVTVSRSAGSFDFVGPLWTGGTAVGFKFRFEANPILYSMKLAKSY